MRVLLDTHAFLWFVAGNARLSTPARATIEDPAIQKFVSAASTWEIAIKFSLGKLTLAEPYATLIPREIKRNGFALLAIEFTDTTAVAALPFHHRDPFDRMLVAQTLTRPMPIVSADTALDAYGIHRIW